ncbi:MAG TPA: 4Fe-4S dicluster domain-containing protein [Alphaproteobacteria bacterium]|nr:4Fe-4S dicluster domain-containing protein [Alphaproteobacteria bacterium]
MSRFVTTRGTVMIDVERCKGCELCIPACPPKVLAMSTARNDRGERYPELSAGCTGCGACYYVCPDSCFTIYQYDQPLQIEVIT